MSEVGSEGYAGGSGGEWDATRLPLPPWRCPYCRDAMHSRFRRSHLRICWMISRLHRRDVDSWLQAWLP